MAVAGGGGDVGPFATEPGRILVVDAENGPGELHRRIRGLGLTGAAAERFHVAVTEASES